LPASSPRRRVCDFAKEHGRHDTLAVPHELALAAYASGRFNEPMSTVDPTLARRLRATRRPSNLRVVLVLALLAVGGAVAGYGWAGFADMMSSEPDSPSVPVLVAIPVGLLLVIVGLMAWLGVVLRCSDVGLLYGLAAVLAGAAGGVLAAPADASGRPRAVIVAAVALVALGAVALLLGAAAASGRARRSRRDAEMVDTGTLTTAVVSDKGYTRFRESDRILTIVTFVFTDLHGTQRWVQRRMVVHASDPIEEGRSTRLWYDAAHPDDDRSIVVELARDSPLRAP
jgi:hypothetical protein